MGMPRAFPVLFPMGCWHRGDKASSCPAAEDAQSWWSPWSHFGEVCPCHRPPREDSITLQVLFLNGSACTSAGSAALEAERGLKGGSWKKDFGAAWPPQPGTQPVLLPSQHWG